MPLVEEGDALLPLAPPAAQRRGRRSPGITACFLLPDKHTVAELYRGYRVLKTGASYLG